jgi:hypothetical protein
VVHPGREMQDGCVLFTAMGGQIANWSVKTTPQTSRSLGKSGFSWSLKGLTSSQGPAVAESNNPLGATCFLASSIARALETPPGGSELSGDALAVPVGEGLAVPAIGVRPEPPMPIPITRANAVIAVNKPARAQRASATAIETRAIRPIRCGVASSSAIVRSSIPGRGGSARPSNEAVISRSRSELPRSLNSFPSPARRPCGNRQRELLACTRASD